MELREVEHVDRILRGAWPGEIPVEWPSRYEPVINTRTAKALGVSTPKTLLLRANAVIE
jgi:putative ABC transport system substrate-binding protein